MIAHLEHIVASLLEIVGGWMYAMIIAVLLSLAVAAFLSLSLFKFDRDSCLLTLRRAHAAFKRGWGWILACGALLLQIYALTQLHEGLMERLSKQGQARYIATQDPGGSPTTQRAPHISFLETSTRTQRIVLPPQVAGLASLPGWSPEEARYGDRPAVNVQDELIKDDKTVVLNRTTSVQRYVAMKLLRSDVDVQLRFKEGHVTRSQAYQAQFSGRYTFKNPFPEARRLHFSFPLPDNSGTLAGFQFKVNGKELPAQDIEKGLDWEGELQPQEQGVVEVGYTNQGARAWSYDVAGRREPIADFHLAVHADRSDIKFLRGSLYPGQDAGGTLDWNLQNQITSQSISLFFPYIPIEQTVGSLYVFAPAAVLIFNLLIVVWATLRRGNRGEMGTSAWRTVLASLACCGGYTLASYLIGYVPLVIAILVSFAVAVALQLQALGHRLWLPVTASALAPFAFLEPGNTGLILTSLGLAALGLTIRESVRNRASNL